jgi:hypothetical protein
MGRLEESKDVKKKECTKEVMEERKECRREKGNNRKQRCK